MTAHHTATLWRTFTRAELAAALDSAGHPCIAECLYSRPDDEAGRPVLAMDYDDPGDLGVFIAVMVGLLGLAEGTVFACAMDTGTGAHPDRHMGGLRGAWWRGYALDEPTGDQWADEISDCGPCQADDEQHNVPDCLTHAVAPWDRKLTTVP